MCSIEIFLYIYIIIILILQLSVCDRGSTEAIRPARKSFVSLHHRVSLMRVGDEKLILNKYGPNLNRSSMSLLLLKHTALGG